MLTGIFIVSLGGDRSYVGIVSVSMTHCQRHRPTLTENPASGRIYTQVHRLRHFLYLSLSPVDGFFFFINFTQKKKL